MHTQDSQLTFLHLQTDLLFIIYRPSLGRLNSSLICNSYLLVQLQHDDSLMGFLVQLFEFVISNPRVIGSGPASASASIATVMFGTLGVTPEW